MSTIDTITNKNPSLLEAREMADAYETEHYTELGLLYAKFIKNASTFNVHNEIFDIFTNGGKL